MVLLLGDFQAIITRGFVADVMGRSWEVVLCPAGPALDDFFEEDPFFVGQKQKTTNLASGKLT
jgi:hypothetical protein